MSTTTVTIDKNVKHHLDQLKRHPREPYNQVITRVLSGKRHKHIDPESMAETIDILSDAKTMRSLARSLDDLKKGKVHALDEV